MIRIVYEAYKHVRDIIGKGKPGNSFADWCKNNGKEYLLDEWDYEANVNGPETFAPTCNCQATWRCSKCGETFDAQVNCRKDGLAGCPNCFQPAPKVRMSLSDWCDVNNKQYLLDEWDYEENDKLGITPDISWSSTKTVSWICPKCGLQYDREIRDRTRGGKGCLYCSSTKKQVKPGYNDFETLSIKDGKSYLLDMWDYEENEKLGMTPQNVAQRCTKTAWWKCPNGHTFKAKINVMSDGKPCPYCTDKLVWPGYNDLETWCEENDRQDILDSWNYDKNSKSPSEILYMDTKKEFWWICPEGHTYHATAYRVIHDNASCQKCTNREIEAGYNDFETICKGAPMEFLLDEWDYEENEKLGITPQNVGKSYQKKVWWTCPRDHHYAATIPNRFRNQSRCPICRNLSRASLPEKLIYYYVNEAFGDRYEVQCNNRQTLENKTELDIYIPALNIAIEYDGSQFHDKDQQIREITKNARCKEFGIDLIRVREPGLSKMNDCYCVMRKKAPVLDDDMNECIAEVLRYISEIRHIDIPFDIDSVGEGEFINCRYDAHNAEVSHDKL